MHDVLVIGAGPAGALAATFLARARLDTLVVDVDQGLTRRAWVPNHLGFPDGVAGPALVALGHEGARKAGATRITAKIVGVAPIDGGFAATTDAGAVVQAREIVLAVGFGLDVARALGCATRPGTEPRVKEIVVVDAAGRTTVPGVWATGTAAGVSMHVSITAADGARVAIELVSARRGERWVDHEVMPTGS